MRRQRASGAAIGPVHQTVLGVVRRVGAEREAALGDLAGAERVAIGSAVIASTAPLYRWQDRGLAGVAWSAQHVASAPAAPRRGWAELAHRGFAGVVVGPDAVEVHSDMWGLSEVYVTEIDGELWFSNRIEALVRRHRSVSANWAAWGSILTLGAPIGAQTPFEQIHRVRAGEAWQRRGEVWTTRRQIPPMFLAAEAGAPPAPGDVVDAVAAQMSPSWERRRPTIPLSGGWDSRLLAAILRRRAGVRAEAWTVSMDDGIDADVELAPAVASLLGLAHHTVRARGESWVRSVDVLRQRVEFQTPMHTWAVPLAQRLQRRRRLLLDGLGGDVLFRGLRPENDLEDFSRSIDRHREVWERLGGRRLTADGFIDPSAALRLRDGSWAAYADEVSPYLDHRSGLMIGAMLNRTARMIAMLPYRVLGPPHAVVTPFMDPEVVAMGLRLPRESKLGGGYYREMLDAAGGPQLAALPSTNDDLTHPRRYHRHQSSLAAVAKLRADIVSVPEVESLLGPRLRRILDAPDAAALLDRYWGPRWLLQGLATFAAWWRHHL